MYIIVISIYTCTLYIYNVEQMYIWKKYWTVRSHRCKQIATAPRIVNDFGNGLVSFPMDVRGLSEWPSGTLFISLSFFCRWFILYTISKNKCRFTIKLNTNIQIIQIFSNNMFGRNILKYILRFHHSILNQLRKYWYDALASDAMLPKTKF